MYILASGISKIGVGLVLYRLASGAQMQVVSWTLLTFMVLMGVMSLAAALVFSLQCRPLSVAWGVGVGECMSVSVIGVVATTLSAVDVAVS